MLYKKFYKNLYNIFWSIVCQKFLDNYERFISKVFFRDNIIPKDSPHFRLYVEIINVYINVLKNIDKHGKDFILKLQERRLRKILKVANKTKWWKMYFEKKGVLTNKIQNLDDFKLIPAVNRFDLLDVPKRDFLAVVSSNPKLIWRRTSGSTTGTPFTWGLNKNLLTVNVLSRFIKEMSNRGLVFDKYSGRGFYIEFNYSPGSPRSEFKWFSLGDFSVRRDDKNIPGKLRGVSAIISNSGNCIVRISPSELPFLIQELKEANLHPLISFCSVVGQPLSKDVRLFTMKYLGCKILVHYGTQETGALSIECEEHYGFYHIFSERVIIEILDEKGKTVAPGTLGNVTVTCLDNTVMPLIRYQPGDVGVLHYDLPCGCENQSPLLEIKNRTTDFIKLSNGQKKPVSHILRRFNREPFVSLVRRVQVQQKALDEIEILLEVRDHISPETLDSLKNRLMRSNKELKIKLKQLSAIPQKGPKFKVFIPLKDSFRE